MYAKSVGFILLLTLTAAAQAPDSSERFYQAIRNDDLTTLRALIREAGVDAKDRQGQTPLMLAAAFGSPEAVRLLLASGADVRAVSSAGVTALHWAAQRGQGAPAARGRRRRERRVATRPHAAPYRRVGERAAESVRLLLAKGAKVNVTDDVGITPLTAAALVNDGEVVKLLLANGATVDLPATTGAAATPLMAAATNGNLGDRPHAARPRREPQDRQRRFRGHGQERAHRSSAA